MRRVTATADLDRREGLSVRTAFYPGSFDPITNGHIGILLRALSIADHVVVGIGIHPGKTPWFSFEEREQLVKTVIADIAPADADRLSVVSFSDLVAVAARRHGASMLIRGLRDGTDLDYEMQMAGMNLTLQPDLSTVFLPAAPDARHITATLVRQIAMMSGDIRPFVPNAVAEAIAVKVANR